MSDSPQQITRREILKRGAVVGGTVLWITPVVQTLGMGRAFAQIPSQVCTATTADQWRDYVQGLDNSGNPIADDRNDPNDALGDPNNVFVSLGFGGSLILRLADRYYGGNSGSALIVESTDGAPLYPQEKARIEVSENLTSWHVIGYATNQELGPDGPKRTRFDLDGAIPPPPNFRWVKLVDVTDQSLFTENKYKNADGFDVDAVIITCPSGAG